MHGTTPLPLRLARWFDDRLAESAAPASSRVRVYGLEVVDDDEFAHGSSTAVRSVFVAEGTDLEDAMAQAGADRALDFDAAAIVEHPWLTTPSGPSRPGSYPRRRRGRVVRVLTFDGRSAVLCRYDDVEVVGVMGEPAA
jgi:hypothetical protein